MRYTTFFPFFFSTTNQGVQYGPHYHSRGPPWFRFCFLLIAYYYLMTTINHIYMHIRNAHTADSFLVSCIYIYLKENNIVCFLVFLNNYR